MSAKPIPITCTFPGCWALEFLGQEPMSQQREALACQNAALLERVTVLEEALERIADTHAELREIKSVRNTRHAMNLVTQIGRYAAEAFDHAETGSSANSTWTS